MALDKILTLGAESQDVAYQLTALLLLSIVYFGAGVALFQKRQLRQ